MIRILTDSTCEISMESAKEMDVTVLPMTVHFGGESYVDGIELTPELFYQKLGESTELPTTTQINPSEFEEVFRAWTAAGDSVVGLFLSSDLSGTYQSAVIAANSVGSDNIFVIDSKTVTFGLGLLVLQAVRWRQEGLPAAALAARLEQEKERVTLLAVVDTLKYLKMGGRLSSAAAMVGGILGINPLITVTGGKVESIGKARGRKAAFDLLQKRINEVPPDRSAPMAYGHSNAPEALRECMDYFKETIPPQTAFIAHIGSVVGTHVGPGAVGVAYFRQK